MTNAVKKMFDISLFNPKKHFPNHAICPEPFWDIIFKLTEEFEYKIDVQSLSVNPSSSQIEVAKRFNKNFKMLILKNPLADLYRGKFPKTQEEIFKMLMEFDKFDKSIMELFKSTMTDLINSN